MSNSHLLPQVRTLNTRNRMWSIAVCDTTPAEARPASTREGSRCSKHGEVLAGGASGDQGVDIRLRSAREQAGSAGIGRPDVGGAENPISSATPIPHQRNGHTCFVWDPRQAALTGTVAADAGENAPPAMGGERGKGSSAFGGNEREVGTLASPAPFSRRGVINAFVRYPSRCRL